MSNAGCQDFRSLGDFGSLQDVVWVLETNLDDVPGEVIGSGSNFTGIGIRQGNTFAASWALPGERGLVRGVNVYRVEPASGGPRLTGRWASMPGPGALQSETLTFLKHMEEEE